MGRVFGFNEEGYRRVQEATRRILGTAGRGSQRTRRQPVLTAPTPDDAEPDADYFTNNCGCSGAFAQGLPLEGSPTVCCEGHELQIGQFGSLIGERRFYHQGGDVWSTYSDDEDESNAYEHECEGEDPDLYDLYFDLSESPVTIRMEPRAALNCDPVCAEWILKGVTYQCFGPNEFELGRFSGWEFTPGAEEIELTRCVCIEPIPKQRLCDDTLCIDGITPYMWVVEMTGLTGPSCCTNMNKEWRCTPGALGCTWRDPASGSGIFCSIAFVRQNATTVHIDVQFGSAFTSCNGFTGTGMTFRHVVTTGSGQPFDCNQEFVCGYISSVMCGGHPASVTIRPLGAIVPGYSGHCLECGEEPGS